MAGYLGLRHDDTALLVNDLRRISLPGSNRHKERQDEDLVFPGQYDPVCTSASSCIQLQDLRRVETNRSNRLRQGRLFSNLFRNQAPISWVDEQRHYGVCEPWAA